MNELLCFLQQKADTLSVDAAVKKFVPTFTPPVRLKLHAVFCSSMPATNDCHSR